MSEIDFEERLTAQSIDDYELIDTADSEDATRKLGLIEDLIESGELMTPDIKPDDIVYFIFKNTVVLEGKVDNVFSQYDSEADKYFYHAVLFNAFYNLSVQYPASEYGRTWFKSREQAEEALERMREE